MTAIELVQEICRSLNLNVPATVTQSTDTNTQFVLACLNRAVAKAVRDFRWQALQKTLLINASTMHEAYNGATGGLKMSVLAPDAAYPATMALYEADSLEPIEYAYPDQFAQLAVYGGAGARYFTFAGGEMLFLPRLTETPVKINFQYLCKYGVVDTSNNSAAPKAAFSLDGDTSPLDDELLILGAIYKYKQELGLEYDDAQADYETLLAHLKNTDGALAPVRPSVPNEGPTQPIIPGTCPVRD